MKLLSLIGASVIAIFSTCCVSTEPSQLVYSDNWTRNVWIESKNKGMCGGVILKTGQIITAKHCLAAEMSVDGKVALVVKQSKKYDLIELTAKTDQIAPVGFNTTPKVTQPIHAFVNQDVYKSVYTNGRLVWMDDDHIFTSTLAAPGISGSAAYDNAGRLVGIFTQIHGTQLNNGTSVITFASAVPAKELLAFLEKGE